MQLNEHDLDSLRGIVRELQQENKALKALLSEHGIPYEESNILEEQPVSDEYDEDQSGRIIPYYPTKEDAKVFYSYFWGRTDVYAKRGKTGGYYPQCANRWDNPNCHKKTNPKAICEDCEYKLGTS